MSAQRCGVLLWLSCCGACAFAQGEGAASRPWPTAFEGAPFPAAPARFALSPDGASLLTFAADGRLFVGPVGGAPRLLADRAEDRAAAIAFSADGAVVGLTTSSAAERTTRLYAVEDGRRIEGLLRRAPTPSFDVRSRPEEWWSHPVEPVAARVTGLFPRLFVAGRGGSDAGGTASGATWSVAPDGRLVGICEATYGGSHADDVPWFPAYGAPHRAPSGARRHVFSLFEGAALRPIAEAVVEGAGDRDADCPVVDAATRSFAVIRHGVVHVGSFDRPDAPALTFATGARSIACADGTWYVGTESGALETWRDGAAVARIESSVGPVEWFRIAGRTAALYGRHRCAACVDGAAVAHGEALEEILIDGTFAVVRERTGSVRIYPDPAALGVLRAPVPNPFLDGSTAALRGGRLALTTADGVAVYDLARGGPPVVVDDRHGTDAIDAAWRGDVLLVRGSGPAGFVACAESRPTLRRGFGDAVWAGAALCDFGTIADLPKGKLGGVVGASGSPVAAARIDGGDLCVVSGPDFAPLRRIADRAPFLPFAVSADGSRVARVLRTDTWSAPPVVECLDVATGASLWTFECGGARLVAGLLFAPTGFELSVRTTWQRGEESVLRLDASGARLGTLPAAYPSAAGGDALAYAADGTFAVASDGRSVETVRTDGFPARKSVPLPPSPDLPPGGSYAEPLGCALAAPRGDAFLAVRLDVVGTRTPRRLRGVFGGVSMRPTASLGRVFVGTHRDGVRVDRAFPVDATEGDVPVAFVGGDAFAVFDGENVVVRAVDDGRTLTVLPGPADFLRGSPDGRFLAVFDRGRVRVHRRL